MEKINVYYSFGGSNKSFKMTMISIISLITNNKNNIINIYLLDCGAIPQYNIKKTSSEKINEINNYIKNSGVDVTLHILNANSLIKKYMLTGPNENWKNSRYTKISLLYIRYLIAFFKVPKKMLWLDSDTIILNDLSELWKTNIDDYEWAGRKDMFDHSRGKDKPFLQNGVMLLNMPKVSHIFEQIIKNYKTQNYGEMGDMLILNNLLHSKKNLNKKFNSFKYTKKAYIWHMCCVALLPDKFFLLSIKVHFRWFLYRLGWYSDAIKQRNFNYNSKKIHNIWDCKIIKANEESLIVKNFPQLIYIYDIYHIFFKDE